MSESLVKKLVLLEPGKYIVAVSGGVDSVVLLNILSRKKDYELIVAHFDHKMRKGSGKDAEFVADLADKYGLEFVLGKAKQKLSSEEAARKVRYEFLEHVKRVQKAKVIITAHHLDDKIETAIFNLRRGTGRRGLTPFTGVEPIRPLRNVWKSDLIKYAKEHQLSWREDPTNLDINYARNLIRRKLIPKLEKENPNFKIELAKLITELEAISKNIDAELKRFIKRHATVTNYSITLRRSLLVSLSQATLKELLHFSISLLNPNVELSQKKLSLISVFCKTAVAGKIYVVDPKVALTAKRDTVSIVLKRDTK